MPWPASLTGLGGYVPVSSGGAGAVPVGAHGRLVAERRQVDLDPGPVAIVLVVSSVRTGWERRLATVVAIQGGNQQQGHEDEQNCCHGSNYARD
jgi:hypothetical protein